MHGHLNVKYVFVNKKKIPIFCSLPQTSQKTPKDITKFTTYSFQCPNLLNDVQVLCVIRQVTHFPLYIYLNLSTCV